MQQSMTSSMVKSKYILNNIDGLLEVFHHNYKYDGLEIYIGVDKEHREEFIVIVQSLEFTTTTNYMPSNGEAWETTLKAIYKRGKDFTDRVHNMSKIKQQELECYVEH